MLTWITQNTSNATGHLTLSLLKRFFRQVSEQCPRCGAHRTVQTADSGMLTRPLRCDSCSHEWRIPVHEWRS